MYTPILKGRAAEFQALEMMNPRTRSRTYPLIEIVPDVEIDPLGPGALMHTFARLAWRWIEPVMVDGAYLAPRLPAGTTALRAITDAAQGVLRIVPVLRIGDDEPTRAAMAEAAARDRNGIAVRVTRDDFLTNPRGIGPGIRQLARQANAPPEDVDVIIDLGLVDSWGAASRGSVLADQMLDGLPQIARCRTVVVASGSFPVDLRDVRPWTLTEKLRHDASLWEQLLERRPTRMPSYGDYGIAHPHLPPPNSGFPSPQLRYTAGNRWLILRGQRHDARSNAQFYEICQQISQHPEFSGPGLGEADRRIASAGLTGPGNPTTWRALGTAHHADLVVSRLIAAGLP